ncbi:cupin-like domain-containing protein [Hyalangium versicolor]|uniref:cupin-like domain-containing protein n=1 Tax=Hyalangium versicolor TaxID=2861190 RepID=UPI001CCB57F1|nr:cupin-like domain-containing protein [Hyalangium versicolor]
MSADSGGGPRSLSAEWREWLVENLLLGVEAEELVQVLVKSDVDVELARAAIVAETQDPHFQGAVRVAQMQRKMETLLDVYAEFYRQSGAHQGVDRHAALSPEVFFERYYFRNRPVVVQGALAAWPALGRWTRARISQEGEVLHAPLLGREEWKPLLEEFEPPRGYASADLQVSAPQLCLERTGAELALRPLRKNLLRCQVSGRCVLELVPSFELHRVTQDPEEGSTPPALRLTVELGAGEMLLLPVGWWYRLQAREDSLAVAFEGFALPEPNTVWRESVPETVPLPPPRS